MKNRRGQMPFDFRILVVIIIILLVIGFILFNRATPVRDCFQEKAEELCTERTGQPLISVDLSYDEFSCGDMGFSEKFDFSDEVIEECRAR